MKNPSKITHPLLEELAQKLEAVNFSESWRPILKKMPSSFAPIPVDPIAPSYEFVANEELFEWIDLVEAVSCAKEKFIMFELGAGYGRWCINAMIALQFLNPIPFHFVAVEAEDTHFKFLKKYFKIHNLKPKDHKLVNAAIDTEEKYVSFHMGESKDWYGQCIDENSPIQKRSILELLTRLYLRLKDKKDPRRLEGVRTITLNSLLMPYKRVDLIDMDIQGKEFEIIKASITQLNEKVKRLHIGTHSHEIEKNLEHFLRSEGWKPLVLLPLFRTTETSYGIITCNDGVQTWINPKIC